MLDSDHRPWGYWEEYVREASYLVKRLVINPGKRFSLQTHNLRSEDWIIVDGEGLIVLNATERKVKPGDHVHIAKGDVHRAEAKGDQPLVIIEIQRGICREDDITRLQDDFGRA